jgi:hypothetical protein
MLHVCHYDREIAMDLLHPNGLTLSLVDDDVSHQSGVSRNDTVAFHWMDDLCLHNSTLFKRREELMEYLEVDHPQGVGEVLIDSFQ